MTTNTAAHIDYVPDADAAPEKKRGWFSRLFNAQTVKTFAKKAAITGSVSVTTKTAALALMAGTGVASAGTSVVVAAVLGGVASSAASIYMQRRAAIAHNVAYPDDQKPVPSLFSKQGLKTLAFSSALAGVGGAYGADILKWAGDKVVMVASATGLDTKLASASDAVIKAASNIFGFFKNTGVETAIAKATPISLDAIKPVAANAAAAVIETAPKPQEFVANLVPAPEMPALNISDIAVQAAPVTEIVVDIPEMPTLPVELASVPVQAPVATPLEQLIHKPLLESITKPLTEEGHSRWFGFEKPWGADVGTSKVVAVAPLPPAPPVDALKEYIHKPILESITKPLTEEGHSRWFGLERPWVEAAAHAPTASGVLANVMSDVELKNALNQIDLTKVSKKTAGIVKEAMAGDGQSIKDLAVFMLNGNRRGIAVNEEQAVALFKKAAALGNAQAKFDLANMEKLGLHGVPENKANATRSLKELAAEKFRPAMQALGVSPTGKSAARATRHVVSGTGVAEKFEKATAAVASNVGCKGDFKTGETICSGGIWDKIPEGRVRLSIARVEEKNIFEKIIDANPLKAVLTNNNFLSMK